MTMETETPTSEAETQKKERAGPMQRTWKPAKERAGPMQRERQARANASEAMALQTETPTQNVLHASLTSLLIQKAQIVTILLSFWRQVTEFLCTLARSGDATLGL